MVYFAGTYVITAGVVSGWHVPGCMDKISESRVGEVPHRSSVKMSGQGVRVPFSQRGSVFHTLQGVMEGTYLRLFLVKVAL